MPAWPGGQLDTSDRAPTSDPEAKEAPGAELSVKPAAAGPQQPC